jgi:hypothetical protein
LPAVTGSRRSNPISGCSGRYWIKAVKPDFRLLTIKEMQALFPDAEIVLERYCGFVKSVVAIKT